MCRKHKHLAGSKEQVRARALNEAAKLIRGMGDHSAARAKRLPAGDGQNALLHKCKALADAAEEVLVLAREVVSRD